MLQYSGRLTRTAVPRSTRAQPCRQTRFTVCRSSDAEVAAGAPATAGPSVGDDAKVNTTISALDALLGPQATPAAPSSRATSSSSASTSAPRPAAAPAPRMPSPPAEPASPAPARKPAGLTFDQVMGFSGLAPEVINGRAAMIGFFLAISHELKTGESVFSQMVSGGALQALVVILAVTIASFAPVIRGTPLDEVFNKAPNKVAEWGPFSPLAEGLNGRAAMLGLALLVFFEGFGPTAFFM